MGGVHAVVVSLEEGLILGLGALLGAGVGLVAVAGLPDESAAVVAELEDAPHADVGGGIGEGEGQGEEEGDEKCETSLHRVGLTEQSQIRGLIGLIESFQWSASRQLIAGTLPCIFYTCFSSKGILHVAKP